MSRFIVLLFLLVALPTHADAPRTFVAAKKIAWKTTIAN